MISLIKEKYRNIVKQIERHVRNNFLRKNYLDIELVQELNTFNNAAIIQTTKGTYFAKLIPRVSAIMKTSHAASDYLELQNIKLETSGFLVPNVVQAYDHFLGTIVLMEFYELSPFAINSGEDHHLFMKNLALFHEATSLLKNAKYLPNDYFPLIYRRVLKNTNKTGLYSRVLELIQAMPAGPLVLGHNDLHEGNIYKSGEKIMLVDFDEIGLVDFRSEIGIVCANLLCKQYKDENELEKFLMQSFILYGHVPGKDDLIVSSLYGLKKLLHAEAYFLLKKHNSDLLALIRGNQQIFIQFLKKMEVLL